MVNENKFQIVEITQNYTRTKKLFFQILKFLLRQYFNKLNKHWSVDFFVYILTKIF